MKPLNGDQQLRSVSLLYSVCAPALKQKPSPLIRRRAWMQAPIEASHGEEWRVFLLDILSHRMSVTAILRQLSARMARQEGFLWIRDTAAFRSWVGYLWSLALVLRSYKYEESSS